MKLFRFLFTLLFATAISTFTFGQITSTAHDFTGDAWNTSGEICIVCHTPHDGNTAVPEAPLWNHETTTESFTLYSGSTLDATLAQPSAESQLCLSCHDGSIALDSYGGATGGTTISGSALVGTDLSNDHPISFTYDAALVTADGGLHDPAVGLSGMPGGGTISDDLLFGGEMQCASCHDVHGTAFSSLLRVSNAGSALCLTCHDK